MRKKTQPAQDPGAIKDPEQWTTGAEPMTGAQDAYVHTLAREAGEDVPEEMTKAEASEKIEGLQAKTGRGVRGSHSNGRSPNRKRR
jgi:Protein of unknown function (DUF3072)